jgi:hypothetical protein
MTPRELSERVRASDDQTLHTISKLTRGLARKLVGENASFEDFEAMTLAISRESDRLTLQNQLQEIEDSFGDAVAVNGKTYVRHEPGHLSYHSLCGTLNVPRATYRQTGVRNGPTVVPLDLAAGLIERGTPAMAKAVALGYAKYQMRGVDEDLEAAQRLPPSRATMERMAVQIAAAANAQAPVIERAVRLQERLPDDAHGIVIGLDRGSVPMAEKRAPGQPPATRRRTRSEPYVRKAPPPIDVNWRMAPVVTVCITDAEGNALVTRKYAATAKAGFEGIAKRGMADVAAALRERPSLRVAVVQDGAHELWTTSRAALATVPAVTAYLEAVDRYHLSERLGKVLHLIEKDPVARRAQQARWNLLLDTRLDAVDEIEREVIDAGPRLDANGDDALHEHRVYLANNKDRMRYVALRAAGLPIGSGTTESGCNTMLNLRVKRNAEHWSVEGLQGVLTLRGIHESLRFEPFWKYFTRRYRNKVEAHAMAA